MKVLSLLFLISVSLLSSGQVKTLRIMNQGLCNVKNLECIKQSDGKSKEGFGSGWIELSSYNIKIYHSGVQKYELFHNITMTETISNNDSYGVFKGTEKLPYNMTLDAIIRVEYATTNYQRTVIYYHNPNSSLGHYYICKSE